jgi:hypothetical protein
MVGRQGIHRVALAAAFLAGTATSALALDPQSVKVGRWTVWSNADMKNPATCSAIVSNGKQDLRLLTDGRRWMVGVSHYGPAKTVKVYYGFEVAGEQATLGWDGWGWAMMPIDVDQLQAFRELETFAITVGTKENVWKLAGAGPAIDRAAQCSRDRGLQAAAAPAPVPVAPAPVAPVPTAPMAAPPMPQEAPPMPTADANVCPPKGSVKAHNSAAPVDIKFHNATRAPIDIYWIGYQGEWKKYHTMPPDGHVVQKSFATHPWIAVDAKGRCLGGVMTAEPNTSGEESANFHQIMEP